ncbi:MAG: hypothetical protein WCH98_00505 [Verrucomicrobiota bacterium]
MARAAALEAIREGTPDQLDEAFADLEALGDVKPDVDWDESAAEQSEDPSEQPEMDGADEDDPFHDGLDTDPFERPEAPLLADGAGDESDDDLGIGSTWHFLVSPEGQCEFARPHTARWMRFRPTSKAGKDAIDDAERRMRMMERIAEWLTEYRKAFLCDPGPWLLGCDAWNEFKNGKASVVPGHFMEIAGTLDFCGQSLFSRYRRAALLVWKDATMRLDFLFEKEARLAWVANVVVQAALEFKEPLAGILDQCKKVTRPKLGSARRELGRHKVEHLDWADLISRANDMADTSWSEVLAIHKDRMLK